MRCGPAHAVLGGLTVFAALAFAFVAGLALQRGHICAVAAVRDVVETHRWTRFAAFLECAAWALACLFLADAAGLMAISTWPEQLSWSAAIAGGVLFGVGALVNGACAFGAIGRLTAGEISFVAFLPGFVVGALAARAVGAAPVGGAMPTMAFHGANISVALIGALALFASWRVWTAWRAAPTLRAIAAALRSPAWPPPLAMAIMAFANVGLLLIVFAWPYTALLVDVALGRGMQIGLRSLIVACFVFGALSGAASAGGFAFRAGSWRQVGARFLGGGLMGLGAAVIPGGNDTLVLLGLPLLQPTAFAAYGAMVATIAAGFIARRSHRRQTARR